MSHHHDPGYRFCPRCGGSLSSRCVKEGDPDRLCCDACEYVFYLDPKSAAGIVARHDGRVVLLRRAVEPAYGAWVFPGGFIDRGEHPQAAAMREAQEEAGIEVRVDGILGIYCDPPGSPVVLIVYHGEVIGGEPAALDESLEVGLFANDDIPWEELAFSTTRLAMRDYVGRRR
jgi:8-oxo-dGTP diphosphatase